MHRAGGGGTCTVTSISSRTMWATKKTSVSAVTTAVAEHVVSGQCSTRSRLHPQATARDQIAAREAALAAKRMAR